MFTKSQVGDPVWSCEKGWGLISKMYKEWDGMLCLEVTYLFHNNCKDHYKQRTGRVKNDYGHTDMIFLTPTYPKRDKPDIPVDTKMIVSKMWIDTKEVKRHFSHWDEFDGVWCFEFGTTSFTHSRLEHYENWEIVEDV